VRPLLTRAHAPLRAAVADADLTLLSLGAAPPRRAFGGRAVWVVGASQGIGEAVALKLAAQGAVLILSARRADALAAVAAACTAAGAPRVAVVPLDLRAGPAAHAAAAAAASAAARGPVSYLFLAAGGTQRAAAEDTSPEVDADMFALNVTALLSLTKAALPALASAAAECGEARIVVLSSAASRLPSPGQAGYAGTKHALNGFFGSLRAELAAKRVGVTLVCPGPVATGAPGQPRVTFGATLAASQLSAAAPPPQDAAAAAAAAAAAKADAKTRLPVPRCAELVVSAAGHGVREAWLGRHPILALLYISQYAPALGAAIIDKVGPKRVAAARDGSSMYTQR
jgi:dehydrogenase/reductase SDR family protein 7